MNVGVVLSNRILRALAVCMAAVGLLDGVIQFSHSKYGFAAFACVLSVYYLYRSRMDPQGVVPRGEGHSRIFKRLLLILIGLCVIEFCLLQIATRTSWLSDSERLGLVAAWVFLVTVCVTALCLFAVVLQYLSRKLSSR